MADTIQHGYDVVVVGKGITGLTAAANASARGASVALVYHGSLCSSHLAYEGVFRFPENVDELERMVAEHGRGLADPHLMSAFFRHYRDFGRADLERMFPLANAKPIGKKHRRGGPGILDDLEHVCRSSEVAFIRATVVKIVASDRILSAVQIYHARRLVTIQAKSVIIASGGGIGTMYRTSDNCAALCTPGTALALDAGARLRDLEFISFHPFGAIGCRTHDGTTPVFTFFNIGENTEIYSNTTDRRIPFIEDLIATRTVSKNPHDNIFRIARTVWQNNGIHIFKNSPGSRQRIDLSVVAHSLIGGIEVGAEFKTAVTGLYAAGEAAAGLNGAGRLPGMALLEGYVTGKQAGINAADHAGQNDFRPVDPEGCLPASMRFGMFSRVLDEVQLIADAALFIERTAAELHSARKRLLELRSGIRNDHLAQHIEHDVLETALAMVNASLARQESRGNFSRQDFPDMDPGMQRNVIIQKKRPDHEMTVFWHDEPADFPACGNEGP